MFKKLEPISVKYQYECFLKNKDVKDAKIEVFETIDGADSYNPSIPFMLDGKEYILCRTQQRNGAYSKVYFFENKGGKWVIDNNAQVFDMEDPAIAFIDGKMVVSGVNVTFGDGITTFTEWRTDFYVGTNTHNFKKFATGPDHMKDIRLIELDNKKIGVFTRPLGEHVKDGHLAKIGFVVLDKLEDINADVLSNAPELDDFFLCDEWGGCNFACNLKNGLIGVIGHKSYKTQIDGIDILHYYGTYFVLNPKTRKTTDMNVIISRNCFPDAEPREDRLADVTFTAGIIRNGDGTAKVYTGLSDSHVGSAIIKDPFIEYEGLSID